MEQTHDNAETAATPEIVRPSDLEIAELLVESAHMGTVELDGIAQRGWPPEKIRWVEEHDGAIHDKGQELLAVVAEMQATRPRSRIYVAD